MRRLERIVLRVYRDLRRGDVVAVMHYGGWQRVGGEVYRGDSGELAERCMDCSRENAPYLALVLKLDFVFRGVYVDIYRRGVNLKLDEVARLGVCCNEFVETRQNGLVEIRVAHIPPVDYKVLQRVSAAGELGTRNKT